MSKVTVDPDKIMLQYHCADCGQIGEQPLCDIVDIGTLICPDCGEDMQLDSAEVTLP
jgi:uncharacterized Zn finger protein (UPF0148 family)